MPHPWWIKTATSLWPRNLKISTIRSHFWITGGDFIPFYSYTFFHFFFLFSYTFSQVNFMLFIIAFLTKMSTFKICQVAYFALNVLKFARYWTSREFCCFSCAPLRVNQATFPLIHQVDWAKTAADKQAHKLPTKSKQNQSSRSDKFHSFLIWIEWATGVNTTIYKRTLKCGEKSVTKRMDSILSCLVIKVSTSKHSSGFL